MQNDKRVIAEPLASNQEAPVWIMEDPFARSPRARFTIGRIMVAIVVMAGLLSLPAPISLIVIAFSIPCVGTGIAQWFVHRGQLRRAAYSFWGVAIPINFLTALSCIAPKSSSLTATFLGLIAVGIPTIIVLGTAWAFLFARRRTVSPRCRDGAGIAVFILAILPLVTLWTLWPLHVAFMAARPTMERLANDVAAGKPLVFPLRAGIFMVSTAAFDPASGDVALPIDANPNGSSEFLRTTPISASGAGSPIVGWKRNVDLGGGWAYRERDSR